MITLDQKTLVPISAMGFFLSLAVGGAWWASAMHVKISQIEARQSVIDEKYDEVVRELKSMNDTLIEIRTVLKGDKRYGR